LENQQKAQEVLKNIQRSPEVVSVRKRFDQFVVVAVLSIMAWTVGAWNGTKSLQPLPD
jgi:hypothetical protein